MPAGRPPKPTELKVLKGDRGDRINHEEPRPEPASDLDPPMDLEMGARRLWDRLAPDMARKRVLTDWDREALAKYCQAVETSDRAYEKLKAGILTPKGHKNPAWQIWREATAAMVTLGASLGLTPAARTRIHTEPEKPKEKGAQRVLS